MFDDGLPPIPIDDWQSHQADQFGTQTSAQIATLAPPTSSDSLSNPLGSGNAPAAPPLLLPADAPVTAPLISPPVAADAPVIAPLVAPAPAPAAAPVSSAPVSSDSLTNPIARTVPTPPPAAATSSTPDDQVVATLNAASAAGVDPQVLLAAKNSGVAMPDLFQAATDLKGKLDDAGGNLIAGLQGFGADPHKVLDELFTLQNPTAPSSSSTPTASTSGGDDSVFQKALAWGLEQQGKPYIWGSAGGRSDMSGNAPGYDCSGFVSEFYHQMGIKVPAQTSAAYAATVPLAAKDAVPGDIVEFNMDDPDPHMQHIAIYLGNGKILQSGGGTVHAVNVGDINGPGGPGGYQFRRATGADSVLANAQAVDHVSTVATTVAPTLPDTTRPLTLDGASDRVRGNQENIASASSSTGVPQSVIASIMDTENGGPTSTSSAGARGFMQIMPQHFSAGEDAFDPKLNIQRGAEILADNYARLGSWDKAAAAYFGAIDSKGNITGARDATGTSGNLYVQTFQQHLDRYGGAPATDGPAPVAGGQATGAQATAAQTTAPPAPTSPLAWLDQQRDVLGSTLSDAGQRATSAVSEAGQGAVAAVQGAVNRFTGPQPMAASQQPTPSDSLTNPTLVNTPLASTTMPASQPTVFDRFGQAIDQSNATIDQVQAEHPGVLANGNPQDSTDPYREIVQHGIPQIISGVQRGDLGMEGVLGGALQTVGGVASVLPGEGGVAHVATDALSPAARMAGTVDAGLGLERAPGQLAPVPDGIVSREVAEQTPAAQRFLQVAQDVVDSPTSAQADRQAAQHVLEQAPPATLEQAADQVVPTAASDTRRFYHGSSGEYSTPDATKFDPDGLFGPGYYLTSDPVLAGSYAGVRAETAGVGANIRPVDVPTNLHMLDADATMATPEIQALHDVLPTNVQYSFRDALGGHQGFGGEPGPLVKPGTQVTGTDVYRALEKALDRNVPGGMSSVAAEQVPADAHRLLSQAGYDGITHQGGLRRPMLDASGQPILHDVAIVFPQALGKLRNAVSGTMGGSASTRFATTVGGAVAGGGTAYATTDPNDPNRWAKVGAGALAGAALGHVGGGLLDRVGSAQTPTVSAYDRAVAASPELQQLAKGREPVIVPPTASIPARLNSVRSAVATDFVRAFTDRQVDINHAQELYAKALGRPLRADEMASELQRLSPDGAAAVKIDEGLKPAIQSVGDNYNALVDYVTARSNVQIADSLGNDARQFSGGSTKAASQKALADIEAGLGPEQFKIVKAAADQVSQFSKELRGRLVDSGVLSHDQAAAMETQYPDWAKTRILDYMKDPAGGQGAGTKIGLSDRNVRAYSVEGTTRAREDPVASTVAYAHQVERMAMKNEAFTAFLGIDQASSTPFLRKVAQDFTATKDQTTIIGFVDGVKTKYVTDNKWVAAAINGTDVMSAPEWTKAWGHIFRSLATSRNPLFLAGNAALDIPTYVVRSSVRHGGPHQLPTILGELARGYGDAFQGLLTGEFKGNTARFLKGGGGQSGYFTGSEGETAKTLAELQRKNVFQINGKGDLLRLAKDLLTLKPIESLGERIELGPRVAAMRLAERRGANATQAIIDGRTVTVDFSQGGTVTKYLNNFVPFLNVGFQGPVQVARSFRENPAAFAATVGTVVGIPTVAAEVWNRSDPQRAKDYADVPDYVKNQGIVVMLPGDTPVDAQGNRKPLYAMLKLREWSPFASIARDATARIMGDDTKSWQDMLLSAGSGVSPTNSTSLGQLGTQPLAGIPVLPAAAQLALNKDFFRNKDIVTQRADDNASQIAKTLTPAFQAVVDKMGLTAEVRPSAIDFLIRDQGAGVGAAVLGAGDLGTARKDNSPQSLPVIGGLVGRFGGSQGGQGAQDARDAILPQSSREILRQNGIDTTPQPVGTTVNRVPLRMEEQTQVQQLANRYTDEAIHTVVQRADFKAQSLEGKARMLKNVMEAARARAGSEVLKTLPEATLRQRILAGSSAP
jgi:cell wall-associated NlpC family hydrolase